MTDNTKDRAPAVGALVFFGTFTLYLMTAAPTVTFWDSGELIAAAYRLGIPHQPGYPLFCITGRLFAFIPIGNIAYRVNLVSAFFSSLSVVIVYYVLLEILRGWYIPSPCDGPPCGGETAEYGKMRCARARGLGGGEGASTTLPQPPPIKGGGINMPTAHNALPLAATLALVLAVVRSFWAEAVVAEVYALNAFFVSMLVFIYVKARFGRLGAARYTALSAFLFGLSVVNHMSMVLYLPALVLTWALLPGGSPGRAWRALAAFSFILLGLSVYIYLPVRSLAGVEPNIGHPETLKNFLWVLKWGEFFSHGRDYLSSAAALMESIRLTDPKVVTAGCAAAFFSWRLLKSDWRLWLPLTVYLAIYTLGISTQVLGGKDEIRFGLAAKFFIPAYILIVVFIGAAVRDLLGHPYGKRLGMAFTAVLFIAASVLAYRNFYPNDYSRNYLARDYAANSLKSAGENGVLFTWGDNGVFPLWYLQMVERYRDGVVLVHTPLMTYDWYLADLERKLGEKAIFIYPYFLGENVFRVLKAAGPNRAVAYDYSSSRFLKLDTSRLKTRGLVYFEGAVPPGDPWPWYVFRGVDDPGVFKGGMEKNVIAIYEYQWRLSGNPALPWHGKFK